MRRFASFALIFLAATAIESIWISRCSAQTPRIRYGITPYQDTALPIIGEKEKWYGDEKLLVDSVPLGWGEVPLALASNSIDVAVYNFNSLLAPWNEVAAGGKPLVFYAPFYVFKGNAIMVRNNAGYKTSVDAKSKEELISVIRQLQGKRIAVTAGTEFEQIVLEALRLAGMRAGQDATIINARPEDALAAFISSDIDAFSAGLTERVEAKKRGGVELIVGSDVSLPVIDGLVTTEAFARTFPNQLDTLVRTWFRTIQYVDIDVANRSAIVRQYLTERGSTKYSPEEYAIAWTFGVFPRTADEAAKAFNEPTSKYYWKPVWSGINEFLLKEGKIRAAVPDRWYWGEKTLPLK
jgi:ABC-type nitrate/sulfonate/bicarbonate transport system substrate-binding protein